MDSETWTEEMRKTLRLKDNPAEKLARLKRLSRAAERLAKNDLSFTNMATVHSLLAHEYQEQGRPEESLRLHRKMTRLAMDRLSSASLETV